jgi:hypothetical protein
MTETISKVADYVPQVPCKHEGCYSIADRFISRAPMGFVKADIAYKCPITDKPITSRREHEENLARHGCRVFEAGEKEEAQRRHAAAEAELDAKVEATAEEFVGSLSTEKREQLGRELDSGLDVSVERH